MTVTDNLPHAQKDTLRDFTADTRVLVLGAMALIVGTMGAAWVLLKLIALFTNLAYFQRVSFAPVSFVGLHLTAWTIAIPVAGSVVIGMIARFGSEKIRGHGIPEAIEAILIGRSGRDGQGARAGDRTHDMEAGRARRTARSVARARREGPRGIRTRTGV